MFETRVQLCTRVFAILEFAHGVGAVGGGALKGLAVALARGRLARGVTRTDAVGAADQAAAQRRWILAARLRAEVAEATAELGATVLAKLAAIAAQPRSAVGVGLARAGRRAFALRAAVALERLCLPGPGALLGATRRPRCVTRNAQVALTDRPARTVRVCLACALDLFRSSGITALRTAVVAHALRAQHDPGGRIAGRERADDRESPKESAPPPCALCRPIMLHRARGPRS